MIFFISNIVTISGITSNQLYNEIKKKLTLANPFFNKKVELGFSTWGIPKSLKYYEEISSSTIQVPIGALPEILNLCTTLNIQVLKDDIVDLRKDTTNIGKSYFENISFTGTLRNYQEDVLTTIMPKTIGVIEAMTGSGKTIIFVKMVVTRKIPTLLLVNTIELMNQTKQAFIKFTNLTENQIGTIGNGKFVLKPITIGLHQSMHKLSEEKFEFINDMFGQIIADEVHIIAAKTYYNTMNKLKAKYKFGFSATPKRDDGLTDLIFLATGPLIHKVPLKELDDVLIKPKYITINTSYYFPIIDSKEYIILLNDLSIDKDRNELIAQTVLTNYKNNYVCLLCNRLEQVYALQELLGQDAVTLTSKTKKKIRSQTMEDLLLKRKKYIISTFGLFSTGIDIPHLDTVVICAPIRSEIKLRQTAGRIMRMAENKIKATIVDFIDVKIEILKNQARTRKSVFKKLELGIN